MRYEPDQLSLEGSLAAASFDTSSVIGA